MRLWDWLYERSPAGRRKKEEAERLAREAEHRKQYVAEQRKALEEAFDKLRRQLKTIVTRDDGATDEESLRETEELLPFFPLVEVLSLQGRMGEDQEAALRRLLNLHPPRYNLAQLRRLSLEREGRYKEWRELSAMEETFCGKIWHTLIESLCRCREARQLQLCMDLLGKVLYHFWLLDNSDAEEVQLLYRRIISQINAHADQDQDSPYLYAVMALQERLARRFGGGAAAYRPRLDERLEIDGRPAFAFSVFRDDAAEAVGIYTILKSAEEGAADLIWEIPPSGGAAVLLGDTD